MKSTTVPILIFAALAMLGSLGCVRRRLTVKTYPPGAAVYVDKQYIGTSPTATPVTYYGTREIEVVRDGYRTERLFRTFNPPWYQLPPLDFVSETLWPRETRDERIVDIALIPQQVMSSEQLQGRANSLRLQAAQGVATPLPPTIASPDPLAPLGAGVGAGGQPSGIPIDPNYPVSPGSSSNPASIFPPNNRPPWQPGQFLRDFFQPGGSPPTRIPEAGILPGGGYRPEM